MRGLASKRRESIARLIRENGFARNSELSSRLGVSVVTIRQDVEALCAEGVVHKTYGGAVRQSENELDSAFDVRSTQNADEKRRIGAAAAKLIGHGETILLDAGSTSLEIARRLPLNADITVVTCALNIAMECGNKPGVTVIVCGGTLNPRTLSVSGHQVERELADICADRFFLATYGVDMLKGLAERNFVFGQTKKAQIRAAREVVLVCDSSKFGEVGPVLIAPITTINRVVTDTGIPTEYLNWLRDNQISVDAV